MSYDFLKAYMASDVPFNDARLIQEAIVTVTEDPLQIGSLCIFVKSVNVEQRFTYDGVSHDVVSNVVIQFPNGSIASGSPRITLPTDTLGPDLRKHVKKFIKNAIYDIVTSKKLQDIAKRCKSSTVFADMFDAMHSPWIKNFSGKLDEDFAAKYFRSYINYAKRIPDAGVFYRIQETLEKLCEMRGPRYFVMIYEESDATLVSYSHGGLWTVYDKKQQKIIKGDPDFIERFKLAQQLQYGG